MEKKSNRILIASIIISIVIVIASLFTILLTKVDKSFEQIDSEILRSMNYTQITDEDSRIDGCDYVQFSSFFTRDLDGDKIAEKLLGTCRNVNSTDTLYMDLNVLTNGYLKDGKITINGTNFNYSMSMVRDNVLKNNYISDNVKTIELNQINAGTQKLIIGDVIANIGNDTNNYSRVSSVTLTGIHVSDEGVETPISKTIDLTVDWHGTTVARLYQQTFYYDYENLESDTISFSVSVDEDQEELILQDNVVAVTIPKLNDYAPLSVKCTNSNIETEYNEETGVLKIKRSSTINEEGIISNILSRYNTYTINVTYPQEAYNQISSYTELKVQVSGYYTGYNNKNEEFKNPYQSNIVNGEITLVFREKPKGRIYNFYVDFMDKKYVRIPSNQYVISKQEILNLYDSEDEVLNKEYVVRWLATRGTEGEVPSMVMNERKESDIYGDKWDSTVMQEYTTNTGIYFSGADKMLGENGSIYVYNNDTNVLIKTFTKDDWNNYTKENPYKYENSVKHIRVETSKANLNSNLSVYNVKELDVNKVLQNFTKEELKSVNLVYTYLTGTCNIEGQASGIVNDIDSAYYVSEASHTEISMQTEKISTQETVKNQKIYIDTVNNQEGDAKWKNGEFLVEIPKEIINIKINKVTIDNEKVKVIAYDVLKKDEKYFIKIITENEEETTYRITIDCNMTPDPRISTTNKTLQLYSYNENCNDYYYNAQDIYDVNGNNNVNEQVGFADTKFHLLAPTSLITLETISDYSEDNEITIAPNVAEVSKETRKAKINVSVTNNYPNTVSDINILGKIPFQGNTYILNGKSLNSKFTTNMTNEGVIVPEELKNKVVVYYSENENPNENLYNTNNGWLLKENVEDFTKIKTYLICLTEDSMRKGTEYSFNYNINIPEGISYNLTSYSTHAVYYSLNTDGGKLKLSTEPNKVGVKIARKISLDLTKYKVNSNLTIPGVTYSLKYTEENEDGVEEETTRILTTDNNGQISFDDLYVGKNYILQEIKVPISCEMNDEEINFEIVENDDGKIDVKLNSGTAKKIEILNDDVLKIQLENEVRYKLNLEKLDSNGQKIDGIAFRIIGKGANTDGTNRKLYTTSNGQISIQGLYINETYTLQELKAEGYYLDNNKDNTIQFKIERNETTHKLEIKTWSVGNGVVQIENESLIDEENKIEPTITVKLQNTKIPTYNLEVVKVNKDGEKLKDTKFRLTSIDTGKKLTEVTDENGIIYINDLYEYVENKYITGEYVLEEIQSPEGYAVNTTPLKFRCTKDENNNLIMQIISGENLIQESKLENSGNIYSIENQEIKNRNAKIENNKLSITVENEPKFKLTKKDVETGKLLPNAKFRISGFDDNKVFGINGEEIGKSETTEITDWTSTTTYEWIKNSDGTYQSGNQSKKSTTSTIKYKFTLNTPGKLSFDWSVSSEESSDYLYYYISNITTGRSISGNNSNERISGTSRGTEYESLVFNNKQIDLTAGDYTVEFSYYKNSSINNGLDTGYIKNIKYTVDSIVETNLDGNLKISLGEGLYKLIEIEAPEGYELPNNIEDRTYTFGIGKTNSEYVLSWDTSKMQGDEIDSGIIAKIFENDSGYTIFEQKITNKSDTTKVSSFVKHEIDKNGNLLRTTEIIGSEISTIKQAVITYDEKEDAYYYLCDYEIGKIKDNQKTVISQGGPATAYYNDILVIGDYIYLSAVSNFDQYDDINSMYCYVCRLTKTGNWDKIKSSSGYTSKLGCADITKYGEDKIAGVDLLGNIYIYDLELNEVQRIESSSEIEGIWDDNFCYVFIGEIEYYKENFYLFNEQKVWKINLNGDILWVQEYSDNNARFLRENPKEMCIPVDFMGDKLATIDVYRNKVNVYDLSGNLIYEQELKERLREPIGFGYWGGTVAIKEVSDTEFLTYGTHKNYSTYTFTYGGDGPIYIYDYKYEITTPDVQEITVNNQLKQYNVTTEIGINSESERTGGLITGTYNETYIESKNIKFVETVKHGYDNAVNILITPDTNYSIVKVTINGEEVNLVPDKNGVVTIPAGYFENMTEDKHVVVTFERGISSILVHHYLKNSDGTYTTISVADDEYYTGKVDDDYTTSPKMNLQDYILEKDSSENYVIPSNASGKYTQNQQVITYYYESKPVTLTVHHYLEGTETKLDDDVVESHKKGYTYQTVPSEDVLKDYELVIIDGEETGILNKNTVVTYYYKLKEHIITTQVQKHKEMRAESIGAEKVEVEVEGGKITGEYTNEYKEVNGIKFIEKLKQKEDSIVSITATPDARYIVKTIKLISTNDKGLKTETIIYGEDANKSAEISYTKNDDESVILTTFKSVTEDKHIIVEFEPIIGTVIVHHYIEGTGEEFGTEPVKVPSKDGDVVENETKQDYVEENYATKANENIAVMYKLVSTSGETSGKYIDGVIHVYYYYNYNNYGYRIEHYYENKETGEYLIDNDLTVSHDAVTYGTVVNVTDEDRKLKTGYEYERQDGSPLIITEIEENNVIRLYYGLADYEYRIEHYYENKESGEYEKDETKTVTRTSQYQDVIEITENDRVLKTGYEYERQEGSPLTITEVVDNNVIKLYYGLVDYTYIVEYYYENKESHEYEQDENLTEYLEAEYQDIINTYEDKVKLGYKFDKTENLPLTVIEIEENNVIKIYYGLADYGYTVEYYYENKESHKYEKDENLTEMYEAEYLDVIEEFEDKVKPGYELDKTEKLPLTIIEIEENNVIKIYYGLADYSYTVEYYYENKESHEYNQDETLTDKFEAEYQDVITKCKNKLKLGYELDKIENAPLTITEVEENNVIKIYYGLADYGYTVEYYYDGVKDENLTESKKAEYQDIITTYTDKVKDGYALEKEENLPLTITETPENNVIKIYYRTQYKITTDVIEHTETYKDRTVKQNVKGGEISGEDLAPYENVFKGDKPKNTIKMTPIRTNDEEYEIVKVVVKENKEDETGIIVDLEKLEIQEDGSIILPLEYLADEKEGMQSNKHIEVEFRKKTNVIIKYLEEGTEKVLYKTSENQEYEELQGYEGKEFETNRIIIPNYIAADVAVTDENKQSMKTYDQVETDEDLYVNGNMYADTITVIYWYKRAPSGIIVRHIETNEKKEEIEISNTTVPGEAGLEKTTYRNKYDKFIPVDGPSNSNENVVVVGKDENVKTLTYAQDKTLEVWYYYEKQYDITTEVKPHEEVVINEETGEKETVLKDGGTISKAYETDENGNKVEVTYEKVLSRGDTAKEIEIKPDAGYRIKSIIKQKKVVKNGEETIEEEQVFIEDLVKEDKSVILPEKFLIDVKNDYNIQVEFEKIPSKVIVKYKDTYTKESILKDKVVDGFVNDKYSESRVAVEGYIPTEPEPENSTGIMKEETIIVIYWYTKQFKITAEVKSHTEEIINEETGEKETKQVLGGTAIIGENLEKEVVLRGNSNTQKIVMTPDAGYRIKQITINDKVIDIEKLTEEKIATIKEEYFTDMQEDKHIIVEYEKIPAKVIIQYLEEETEKPLSEEEIEEGYVNDKYETKEKDIEYYEFVKEKYPENSEGLMTEDEIIVKYYYKQIPFNMKIEKEIESIVLNGQNVEVTDKNKAKLEIKYKNINETELVVSYKIKVTNTEKVEGIAIVEEIIPEGFEMVLEESNKRLEEEDGKYILKTGTINPGETIEYKVTLRWSPKEESKGEKINTVKITKTINTPNFEETTLEDNEDTAIIEIKLDKTIQDVINDIKEEAVKMPKTGQTRVVYILTGVIAGICVGIIIWRKKKANKSKEK